MTTPVLLTGGTGTLGRRVLPRLRDAGREVRILSRTPHASTDGVEYVVGDLSTGDGVDAAVTGVHTIVHCAGSASGDEGKAATLVRAAGRAGIEHVVLISVVGADRVPVRSTIDRWMFGYFAMKRMTENVFERSGVPFTTLRATQFYDLVLLVVRGVTRLPVALAPSRSRFQPVDADDVAARLVELALGSPRGLVAEFAGPRAYGFDELVRSYLDATGRRRPVVHVRAPGHAAAAVRAGAILPTAGDRGSGTWEDFLAAVAKSR